MVLYMLIILVFENFDSLLTSFFSNEWIFILFITYLSSEILHFIAQIISRQINFSNSSKKYILFQLFFSLLVIFVVVYIAIHIYFTRVIGFSVYGAELLVFELFYLFSAILYNLYILSYLFLSQENNLQLMQEAELSKRNGLMLESLKLELSPEILFSTLESVMLYKDHEPTKADEMIDWLSSIYRYRIENKYHEMVSLEQEMSSLEKLLKLRKYCNPGAIEYQISGQEGYKDYLVLPLWLHRLVLQIADSNIISPVKKFFIFFELEGDKLIIRHSRQEKLLTSEEKSIGDISADFSFYTGRLLEINEIEDFVILKVPLFFKGKSEDQMASNKNSKSGVL
jgi:hypothetical protein